MPIALLLLIEKLVLSPVVQDAAWALLKPHLIAGSVPPAEVLSAADAAADQAHAEAHG